MQVVYFLEILPTDQKYKTVKNMFEAHHNYKTGLQLMSNLLQKKLNAPTKKTLILPT